MIKKLGYWFRYRPNLMGESPAIFAVGSPGKRVAMDIAAEWPKVQTIVYEADPQNLAEVANLPSIKQVCEAISDTSGEVTLYQTDKSYLLSSVYPRQGRFQPTSIIRVTSRTLDEAMCLHNLSAIDLLLLNCEGAEFPILHHLVKWKRPHEKVRQICVSFHAIHGSVYTREERQDLLEQLQEFYTVTEHEVRYEYHLLVARDDV